MTKILENDICVHLLKKFALFLVNKKQPDYSKFKFLNSKYMMLFAFIYSPVKHNFIINYN